MKIVHGQPAWILDNGEIEMAVTQLGAQMAPVVFAKPHAPFNPYYVSPWQSEDGPQYPPVLTPLRGDFICLPFGANNTAFNGERHPLHGEVAGEAWTRESLQQTEKIATLRLSLETRVRPGRILRNLSLVKGHPAVYCSTIIHGFAGPTPFAHHAILAVPEKEKALLLSTSPFALGMVDPDLVCDPINREYQSLAMGGMFTDLARVPCRFVDTPAHGNGKHKGKS